MAKKSKKRLTHMQSCWFAYYTSSNYDILIAVGIVGSQSAY